MNIVGIIYIAINKINGKYYVGKTIDTLNQRMAEHYYSAFNIKIDNYNCKFYRAIRKYKKENFEWHIIYDHVPIEIINKMEIFTISNYNSFNCGYNSTLGGDGIFGLKHTEISKDKMSKSHIGKKMSNEFCKKQSIRISGENNPMYGIKMPEEHRQKLLKINIGRPVSDKERKKMSLAGMGRKKTAEHIEKISYSNTLARRKKFEYLYKDFYIIKGEIILGKYHYPDECAKFYNLNPSLIWKCLKKERKHHKNYHFIFIDEHDRK